MYAFRNPRTSKRKGLKKNIHHQMRMHFGNPYTVLAKEKKSIIRCICVQKSTDEKKKTGNPTSDAYAFRN